MGSPRIGTDDPQPLLAGHDPFLEVDRDTTRSLRLDEVAASRVQQPELEVCVPEVQVDRERPLQFRDPRIDVASADPLRPPQ